MASGANFWQHVSVGGTWHAACRLETDGMCNGGDIELEAWRAKLTTHRNELLRLAEASAESRAPVELDQSRVGRLSRMEALQDQAMAIEAERRRELELRRIDAALARIDEGEFGYCANCGEAIPLKRLELDPTTPVCVDCARGG